MGGAGRLGGAGFLGGTKLVTQGSTGNEKNGPVVSADPAGM